jgi:alpha-glucan,water dikinase
VALPFGVFDAVLADRTNQSTAKRFQLLLNQISSSPESKLAEMRDCILGLDMPASLIEMLKQVMLAEGFFASGASSRAGEDVFGDGGKSETVALRIKQVWASLWNDRAYFSRESNGLPHDRVSMAVLIQEVVKADYAFVIHTVNPATGNSDEIYAEVVSGLGETLVGNYPGRALSFVVEKSSLQPRVLAYPSKSLALRGGGLIFRSDSNAEDLEGYAGAGLYDSVLLQPAYEECTDYTSDPLVWDVAFQREMLRGIGQLACAVEKSFGSPQDIEGAWVNGEFHVVQTRPQVGSA